MVVDILGTRYEIKEDSTLKDVGADGLCKSYSKEILHRNVKDMLCKEDPTSLKEVRKREVLRHELIHAFFFEAGLEDQCYDERLVDWMAKQFPKMERAMRSCGALTGED